MKHQITIKPVKGKKGAWLNTNNIKIKDEEFVVTRKQTVILKKNQMPGDEPIFENINDIKHYTFNYDDSIDENRNTARKQMADVLRYHHNIVMEGFKNPNLIDPLFEMEDLAANDMRNYNQIAISRIATNKVWDMTYREKVDLMYFLGENPKGMGHKQVAIRLLEPTFGVVYKKLPFGLTGKTFTQFIAEDYQAGSETQSLRTSVLKAQAIVGNDGKFLIHREGATLYVDGTPVGSNEEDVMVWLNQNQEKKKYLLKQVSMKDTLDADDVDLAQVVGMGALDKKKTEQDKREDFELMKSRAKDLMIKSPHLYQTAEKLSAAIQDAENVHAEIDLLGLRPQIAVSKKKLFVEDLKEIIAKAKKDGVLA